MDFNSDPKVPFPGVLDIGQFHSPHADEALEIGGLFHQGQFPYCIVDMRQGESNIFQISTWKAFLLLKGPKNIFIMKNRKNGRNRC